MGLSMKSDKAKTGSAPESSDRDASPRRYRTRIKREPVLDRVRVQELAGGIHSQSRLLEFLNLFLVLLPSRVNNVVSAMDSGDHEAASAAAQSLASSAAMAGAAAAGDGAVNGAGAGAVNGAGGGSFKEAVAGLEKRLILEALNRAGGNRSKAAEELGIYRRLLYAKLREYEIGE
jgi:transcriptional regulator of acetoin/glycerol metabolism